jgi:hypothetical protein
VVLVGETAARPAQVGDVQGLEGLDDVQPDATLVGHLRVLADEEAAVDAVAEVLGEVAVECRLMVGPGMSRSSTPATVATTGPEALRDCSAFTMIVLL